MARPERTAAIAYLRRKGTEAPTTLSTRRIVFRLILRYPMILPPTKAVQMARASRFAGVT